jgi:serine/threonine protein kinase/WD40 repeat protein
MPSDRWRRVEELYHAALDLPPEQRSAFIQRECDPDLDLRQELESLLAAEEPASELFQGAEVRIKLQDAVSMADEHPVIDLVGKNISHYRVLSRLGAGGMGEVYRARDTRIERDVALKVLPHSLAGDRDRLRRFEQEARTVGKLNHPNILSLYDIGEQGEIHFIVTELLEGATLRQKLGQSSFPPRRAIEYAMQIAHGLAAAHEKGIIHRDIKPENLFITKDARIKILDFGLAKQSVVKVQPASETSTLTGSIRTSEGIVLGTVGYMSPEQVRGEPADHRGDIFAFGAVFYEMLSGQRAFARGSSVETMNAILKEEPPEVPATEQVPPGLDRIVRRCLEKDASERFQSAKDLGFALESITTATTQRQMIVLPKPRHWWRIAGLVLGLMLLVAGVLVTSLLPPTVQQPEYRQLTFRRGNLSLSGARFTRDGQTIVYSAAWDNPQVRIYSSRADGTETRGLDLPNSNLLAVSRSGELAIVLGTAGVLQSDRLARVPLSGGAPRELLDHIIAADWSPDGTQLAVSHFTDGKWRLEYPIGKVLYEKTTGFISNVRVSPQGDAIAFMDHPIDGDDRGVVAIVDLKGNKRTLTSEWSGEWGLAWSPKGREVWFSATTSNDWERALYGVSRSGKQRLIMRTTGGVYLEDIATDGRVLLERREKRYEIVASNIGGGTRLLSWLPMMEIGSLSRDGELAVIRDTGGGGSQEYGIYLAKLDGSPAVLLGSGFSGRISPDKKWVTSILASDTSKVILLPTEIGETRIVTAPKFHYRNADWASDGHRLVVYATESDRPFRFWVQSVDGGLPRPITPEGIDGLFVTINHADFVATRGSPVRLYSIDGGQPKAVSGALETDSVIGGSLNANVLYVTANFSTIPQKIFKVNVANGERIPFVTVFPVDPAGIILLEPPRFSVDEKRYVWLQDRELSVLYLASGIK